MPSTKKKTPAANLKKKVTASARARTSVRKPKKPSNELHGSYIQPVSTVTATVNDTVTSTNPQIGISSSNDAILSLLQDMNRSNQDIVRRIDALERQQSTNSTPIALRSQSRVHGNLGSFPTRSMSDPTQGHQAGFQSLHTAIKDVREPRDPITADHNLPGSHQPSTATMNTLHCQDPRRDTIISSLDALRSNPTLSQAVSQILSTYEGQAKLDAAQGKAPNTRRSGRFNATDIVTTPPELRWANEGFHGGQGKKWILYDDLTLNQWAVGQLTKVHQIKDPGVMRQALLQTILALKDATSLPWQAVRSAWATSMHKFEEGSLTWADATQWALIRLSASQIAMANSNVTSTTSHPNHTQQKKICKFFNEGSCSYDNNHGTYRHICVFCAKQGRNLNHPESRCNFKNRIDRPEQK